VKSGSRRLDRADVTPVTGSGGPPVSYSPGNRPELTPSGGTGGRRAVLMAGVLALLIGGASIFLVGRHNNPRPFPVTDAAKAAPASPEVIQLPQETRLVRVRSEPPGARVFEGPRLIGESPVDLKLPVDSAGMMLTLVHEGRADLSYLVRPADAPEITLRLSPPAGSSGPTPGPSHTVRSTPTHTHPTGKIAHPVSGQPKVEIFDDASSSQRPKVDAIDDQ
jgi:hypothetical protein